MPVTHLHRRVDGDEPTAAIICPAGMEWLDQMDAERERRIDEALARMRAALADVPEEQLMQDVAEIIEHDRQEQRPKAPAPTHISQPVANGKFDAKPTDAPSRERIRAIIREMAVKHRQSLETLAAYDRGEIERPQIRRASGG